MGVWWIGDEANLGVRKPGFELNFTIWGPGTRQEALNTALFFQFPFHSENGADSVFENIQ